jgi:hypothetical protein
MPDCRAQGSPARQAGRTCDFERSARWRSGVPQSGPGPAWRGGDRRDRVTRLRRIQSNRMSRCVLCPQLRVRRARGRTHSAVMRSATRRRRRSAATPAGSIHCYSPLRSRPRVRVNACRRIGRQADNHPFPAHRARGYYVVVDAPANVAKHADAPVVAVEVMTGEDPLQVWICDGGARWSRRESRFRPGRAQRPRRSSRRPHDSVKPSGCRDDR